MTMDKSKTDLINFLKEHCSEYFNNNAFPLFRADYDIEREWRMFNTDKTRKPVNTSKLIHDITNEYFHQKFGKALRTETIFAGDMQAVADKYVDYRSEVGATTLVYWLIPFNSYELYYSMQTDDYYNWVDHSTSIAMVFSAHNETDWLIDLFKKNEHFLMSIMLSSLAKENLKELFEFPSTHSETVLLGRVLSLIMAESHGDLDGKCASILTRPILFKMLELLEYKKSKTSAHNGLEVMVDCDSYVLINPKIFDDDFAKLDELVSNKGTSK